MIQKVRPNNKEVEMLLSKLLDWNFEVIKNEIRSKGNISAHYSQTINPVHMNFL